MPCQFTAIFFIESISYNLTVYFLDETSCPHNLSMNYFQNVNDEDSSSFLEIYNSITHDQVYLITGNMTHHPSKSSLVYPQLRLMCILTAELDATYHDSSHTCFNLKLNAIRLFVLPSDHRH